MFPLRCARARARTTFRSARTAFTYWPMLSIGHECYCSRGRPMRAAAHGEIKLEGTLHAGLMHPNIYIYIHIYIYVYSSSYTTAHDYIHGVQYVYCINGLNMGKEKHKLGENDISKTKIEGYVKNRDDLVFLEIGGKCINSAEIWEKVQMNFKSMMPLITFIIIISGLPPMEHSHFLIHEASSPQTAVGPETSVAARRTFGHSAEENSSAGSFPQPLARQAWGRCLAVSKKTVYSALAAWHPVGLSVWVVSHGPSPLPR